LMDEFFDRTYQHGRAELNAALGRACRLMMRLLLAVIAWRVTRASASGEATSQREDQPSLESVAVEVRVGDET